MICTSFHESKSMGLWKLWLSSWILTRLHWIIGEMCPNWVSQFSRRTLFFCQPADGSPPWDPVSFSPASLLRATSWLANCIEKCTCFQQKTRFTRFTKDTESPRKVRVYWTPPEPLLTLVWFGFPKCHEQQEVTLRISVWTCFSRQIWLPFVKACVLAVDLALDISRLYIYLWTDSRRSLSISKVLKNKVREFF